MSPETDSPTGAAPRHRRVVDREFAEGKGKVKVFGASAALNMLLAFLGTCVLSAALVAAAVFWRLNPAEGLRKVLQTFEFTVAEPVPEDPTFKDPMRDILMEKPEDVPEDIQQEERPDIHMTVKPTDIQPTEEVIQTTNIQVETPDIQVRATEVDLDAPEEISERSDVVQYQAPIIAAKLPGPGDIFQYKTPTPRDKPALYWVNRAPRPSRTMKVLPKAFGDQDAPSYGELGPYNINLSGTGDFFRTMTKWGGVQARSAVDAALRWLAIHQEAGGMWDAVRWGGQAKADAGVSGLALLAFLGGGNTTRRGEYRRNVLRGVEALIRLQEKDGAVDRNIYCHSMATIALCEAYGRARDERVGQAARKAVNYLLKAGNPDGGWRYTANCGISDLSVSAWCIQALKAAKLAHIDFDNSVYSRALTFTDSVTDKGGTAASSGDCGYTYQEDQSYGGHTALTAAGMVVRQFSNIGIKNHLLVKGAEILRKHEPNWNGDRNFYLWYYATYAMHNMGGEHRVWWNRRIRDVLIEHQLKTGEHAGSWDYEATKWGTRGGRVYTTSLGALCLEVYYRYSEALNSFGVAPEIDDLFLR